MRNVLAVAGKEIRAYFHSPIAYLVMTIYSALCGFFFYSLVASYIVQVFRTMEMGGPAPGLNQYIIRPLLEGILTVVLLILIPLITMRLFAEEKRSGTIELLLTSPLTDAQIIFGKFLGALLLYAVLIVLTFIYISLLLIYGNPSALPLVANALGMLLFGAGLLALGMWISSLTKNQIIAGAVAFCAFLLLYVLNWVNAYSSGMAGRVLDYVAVTTHFDNFAKGVIDLGDVVYFVSVIVVGLFLTSRSLEALKGEAVMMAEEPRGQVKVRQKALRGANFAFYTIVVLAIVVLCNWFVSRNDHHLDLTPNKAFSLSPETMKLLKGLDQPVTVYDFNQQDQFGEQRDLLRLYSSASHYLTVRYVDPNRDPSLAKQLGVQSMGSIYVSAAGRHLAASDTTEQGITNALIGLLKGQKTIYFVQGEGERDLDGVDRDGYSSFKQALENEDSQVKTLVLLKTLKIPADCSILVIAGPKNDYLPQEVTAVESYLKGGGRLLAMLDPGVALPNLSKMLSDYGVTARNDLVIDENPVAQIFGTGPSMPLIMTYGDHPIVQPLKRTATLFPLTRSFDVASTAPSGVVLDSLCKTSQASFSVTNFNPNMREVSYVAGKDVKGPLSVAVSGSLTLSGPGKEGRFVATGSSLIVANAYIRFQGNRDLVMNMVEWLSSNEGLISIRPKAPSSQHLNLTASQMGGLLLRCMAIPVVIIIIGIGVWWSRR